MFESCGQNILYSYTLSLVSRKIYRSGGNAVRHFIEYDRKNAVQYINLLVYKNKSNAAIVDCDVFPMRFGQKILRETAIFMISNWTDVSFTKNIFIFIRGLKIHWIQSELVWTQNECISHFHAFLINLSSYSLTVVLLWFSLKQYKMSADHRHPQNKIRHSVSVRMCSQSYSYALWT